MTKAGFGQYSDLPVLDARNFARPVSEFPSPTKLERHGLVSISDPELEDIPQDAQVALSDCNGESGAAAAASAIDDFKTFRDSKANPLLYWSQIVRTETAKIADADDPAQDDYRQCFKDVGVPADQAANPTDAINWLIGEASELTVSFPPDVVDDWKAGEGILDGDGGKLARASAGCFRLFEAHIAPSLEEQRDALVEDNREAILKGQDLFTAAIGSQSYDPDGYVL